MNLSYSEFTRKVNAYLILKSGLGMSDLGDYLYYDAWKDEVDPEEVADAVLEENGFPGE